jgi:hypothetical protein
MEPTLAVPVTFNFAGVMALSTMVNVGANDVLLETVNEVTSPPAGAKEIVWSPVLLPEIVDPDGILEPIISPVVLSVVALRFPIVSFITGLAASVIFTDPVIPFPDVLSNEIV